MSHDDESLRLWCAGLACMHECVALQAAACPQGEGQPRVVLLGTCRCRAPRQHPLAGRTSSSAQRSRPRALCCTRARARSNREGAPQKRRLAAAGM